MLWSVYAKGGLDDLCVFMVGVLRCGMAIGRCGGFVGGGGLCAMVVPPMEPQGV